MLGLYDKMVMDAKSSGDEAQAKRKLFKHMGEFKTTKTPVAVLFRTVPQEENNLDGFCKSYTEESLKIHFQSVTEDEDKSSKPHNKGGQFVET